jgi:hypothetical protein
MRSLLAQRRGQLVVSRHQLADFIVAIGEQRHGEKFREHGTSSIMQT